jgi:hypothetical protein
MTTATRSTVIAAFASRADATRAILDLFTAGFTPQQLGLVLPYGTSPDEVTADFQGVNVYIGGTVRELSGADISDAEIRYYEEDIQEGRPLVVVRTADRYQEAIDILHRCGGTYMATFEW